MSKPSYMHGLVFYSAATVSLLFISWLLADKVNPKSYLGSNQCSECHQQTHSDWSSSLHHKMMRKVEQENALIANLSAEDAPFNDSDAVWVIGSKWQQQFMGQSNGKETLLPGAWTVSTEKWSSQGWDGWQIPDPIQRCHGCHTVGLNLETGTFVEPGIGCESCHGPASRHVESNGRIRLTSSVNADICGQCHSRGMATDSKAFFPYTFVPGEKLEQHFSESEADFLQNSSQWWGTGREKKRHQEYTAWRRGGHSNSLKTITESYDGHYGDVTAECLSCHAGEAAVQAKNGLNLHEVENGVTCSVCHNVHGDLNRQRMSCSSCHGESASYHDPEPLASHIPCPVDAKVNCVDCHMPLTVKMGGEYLLRSHAPGITMPSTAAKFDSPSSCANGSCHKNSDSSWLQQEFDSFYRAQSTLSTRDS